jgi:hypothetical protein
MTQNFASTGCRLSLKFISKKENLPATSDKKGTIVVQMQYFYDRRFWQIFAKIFVFGKVFAKYV